MRAFEDWLTRIRFFPRVFSIFYLFIVYEVNEVFWLLPEPSNAHAGAYAAIVTSAAAWFKFYVDGGKHDATR